MIIEEGRTMIIEEGADEGPSPPLLMFFSGCRMEMTWIPLHDLILVAPLIYRVAGGDNGGG